MFSMQSLPGEVATTFMFCLNFRLISCLLLDTHNSFGRAGFPQLLNTVLCTTQVVLRCLGAMT